MNTCETILALLTQIEINTGTYCCDVVDITDGDRFTDPVEDGEGLVPQNIVDSGYAEDTSDWDGFASYKCIIAHLMVNNMKAQVEKIHGYMLPVSGILGGIPVLAAVASIIFVDSLSVLVYAIATGAWIPGGLFTAVGFLGKPAMEDLIDDMDTHHDALACAIYRADGSDDAIVALKAEIDSLFSATKAEVLNNLNLPAQMKALYDGRYGEQDIAQIIADEGYVPGDFECCLPIPPSGAYAWPIEITNVSFPADDATFTTHSSSWDEDGFTFDATHHPEAGHYYLVTLTLAVAPYYGTGGSHRGIVYHGARYTYNASEEVRPDGGIQDIDEPAGFDNQNGWRMIYSSPYAEFDEDVEDYLGISFAGVFASHGLQQSPNIPRQLVLRFWCKDISDPNHRFDGYLTQLYWAIDNN